MRRSSLVLSTRILVLSLFWALLPASSIRAEDLSRYRGFQLGMDLTTVAGKTDMHASRAKLIHERPATIQELEWQPGISLGAPASPDPVKEIFFGFCNDRLYRILINYDQRSTEGLGDQDLIEAISAQYGKPARPIAGVVSSSLSRMYSDTDKVIARWEDSEHSLSLFRLSYDSSYGMVLLSKRLDAATRAAVAESVRLNDLEAPQREIERQKKQIEEKRAAEQKARAGNKENFRP